MENIIERNKKRILFAGCASGKKQKSGCMQHPLFVYSSLGDHRPGTVKII